MINWQSCLAINTSPRHEAVLTVDSCLKLNYSILPIPQLSQFQVSSCWAIKPISFRQIVRTCFNSYSANTTMKAKVQQKSQDKRSKLVESERRFKRACEQIVQLNYSLDALQQRYNRAKKDNHRSFRYSLRLRIAVVDGMRNMYYDYAHQKAETVAQLRQELFGEVVDIISDESSADVQMYE